jgi:hypothetical protein
MDHIQHKEKLIMPPLHPNKNKECLIQGLKHYFDIISEAQEGIIVLKNAVIALEPDLSSILTPAQQDALTAVITDQNAICNGSVYSVIEGKTTHPSHRWRRILGLQ